MLRFLRKDKYFILLIFFLAFFLRLGYAFREKPALYDDALGFDAIGQSLAEGRGYRLSDRPIEQDIAIIHPPVYPLFLSIIYRIFGYSHKAVWVIQSILSALVCVFIFWIAKALFGLGVARLSAIISAFFFTFIIYSAVLFSEAFFLFLLLLCFIYIYKAEFSKVNIRYLWPGFLAGLSIYTRTIILPFFIFLSIFFFGRSIKKRIWFLLPIVLLASLWITRNYYVYQRFIPVSVGGGEMFLNSHDEEALAHTVERQTNAQDYIAYDNTSYQQGLQFILKHPLRTISLEIKKVFLFFNLRLTEVWWSDIQENKAKLFPYTLLLLFNFFTFFFAIMGIVFSYLHHNRYIRWMRLFIYVSILSLVPFIIETRYRMPLYPFFIIFAAYGLSLLPQIRASLRKHERKTTRLFGITLIIFLIILAASFGDLFSRSEEVLRRIRILRNGTDYMR